MEDPGVVEVRRRVQNETLGHRGRKDDPLYRCRKLLAMADERLDDNARSKLLGLLDAGDPRRFEPHGPRPSAASSTMSLHPRTRLTRADTGASPTRRPVNRQETIRGLHDIADPDLAQLYVERLGHDLQDDSCPPEIQQLGRTIVRWSDQIAAWHCSQVTNGPTEAINNLIKRVKRVAFGFRRFTNYRVRALLYAGKPNWDCEDAMRGRALRAGLLLVATIVTQLGLAVVPS